MHSSDCYRQEKQGAQRQRRPLSVAPSAGSGELCCQRTPARGKGSSLPRTHCVARSRLSQKRRDRPERRPTKKPDQRSSFKKADGIFRFVKSFSKTRKSENRFTQKTGRKTVCPVAHAPGAFGAPGSEQGRRAGPVSKGGERERKSTQCFLFLLTLGRERKKKNQKEKPPTTGRLG